MRTRYVYRTAIGLFRIVEEGGEFSPYFGEVSLGQYREPQFAADDLADGCTKRMPNGVDTGTLGIPHDLSEWDRCDG